MKNRPARPGADFWRLRNGEAEGRDGWPRLGQSALDRDLLDAVDLSLIQVLAERAGRPGDLSLKVVLACLLAAVKTGGLRIPLEEQALAARLEQFLRSLYLSADPDSPGVWALGFAAAQSETEDAVPGWASAAAREFSARRRRGDYAAVLGAPPDFLPLLESGGCLYFQKYQAAEASVGAALAGLLGAPDSGLSPETLGNIFETVLKRYPLRLSPSAGAPPMAFNANQKLALAAALRKRFLVVSGGPGTGKTSLIANLLRVWIRARRLAGGSGEAARIRLGAPTGRAAQRLSESLRRSLESIAYGSDSGVHDVTGNIDAREAEALDKSLAEAPCETLHRMLRYRPDTGEYHHGRLRPLAADLVVVDEVSMVDVFTLSRLLDALPPEASLVLLGDMDQLPSVEAGAVLADLVPGTRAHAFSPEMLAWLEACVPDVRPSSGPSREPSPLRDHLVLLEASHRSEAGILNVTRRVNVLDGKGALAAMAAPMPAPVPGGSTHFPVAFLEGGGKSVPGGGCRMLEAPGGGFAGGRDAWLDAWMDFHYLRHSHNPAAWPGKILADPRQAAYGNLVEALARRSFPGEGPLHAAAGWKFPSPTESNDSHLNGNPELAAWLGRLDELFAYLDLARVLTLTRMGWYGSSAVNRRFRDRLASRWDGHAVPPGVEGFHGAPIMILENDYGKGLYNGEVGILLRLQGRYTGFFHKAGAFVAFPAPFLPRHELAFAMTVHKSQGSEYDQVMLVLPEPGNRLLFKETLYTALTRARYFAGIYGPPEVFLEAVGRRVIRESGLPGYLG